MRTKLWTAALTVATASLTWSSLVTSADRDPGDQPKPAELNRKEVMKRVLEPQWSAIGKGLKPDQPDWEKLGSAVKKVSDATPRLLEDQQALEQDWWAAANALIAGSRELTEKITARDLEGSRKIYESTSLKACAGCHASHRF